MNLAPSDSTYASGFEKTGDRVTSGLRWTMARALLVMMGAGCATLGSVALEAGDFAGAKADAHCDRRFVTDGGQASAFCQEVVNTVAAAEFADDCRAKHQASAAPGKCSRSRIIAGCKLQKHNDDDSLVWDWYYDVSDVLAEAGPSAGPDGGPTFDAVFRGLADVERSCRDRSRYDEGAELAQP